MSEHGVAQRLGLMTEGEIEPAVAALSLAALGSHNGIAPERYGHHLKLLSKEVAGRHESLIAAGAADNAETQLAALKHVLSDMHDYKADEGAALSLDSFNLIRTIDRRCGAPIMLALLYVHAGCAQGWSVAGLNVPGHFMARVEKDGQRLIFNPAQACALMNAADLRAAVKKQMGPHAELSSGFFEPVGNRGFLVQILNAQKLRYIEAEDYGLALAVVEAIRAIDPQEYRVLLDAGVLYARTGKVQAAIEALETYIEKAPRYLDRQDAMLLLRQLRENGGFDL
jgi:regulator of sirC expression with transglutaminase-like and TPR domain